MSQLKKIEELQNQIKNLNFQLDVSPWAMGPSYRAKIAEAEAELERLRKHTVSYLDTPSTEGSHQYPI